MNTPTWKEPEALVKRPVRMVGNHIYIADGMEFPSVTTMLANTRAVDKAAGLAKWQNDVGQDVALHIMKESSKVGTLAHDLCENYLWRGRDESKPGRPHGPSRGEGSNRPERGSLLAKAHRDNLIPYLDKIDNIRGTEIPLVSPRMRLGGTSDCIAEYDGVLSVIDYKTKRSRQKEEWLDEYFIQGTAYGAMYNYMVGETPQQVVILVSAETDERQEFIVKPEDWALELSLRLQQYDSIRSKNK